jgi:geranylgeranyl transferase type-2 subunit alpha
MDLEKSKIELYQKLSNKVLYGNKKKIFNESYFKLVSDLLDWNPELYTVWNYRKELILNYFFKDIKESDYEKKHSILVEELYFVLKKLKKYPKSYWIWNHRIWCLKLDKFSDWAQELKFIDKFLEADFRNYHVWSYRRFIINCMKNDSRIEKLNETIDFDEFRFTTKMINKDISNYSAWHNRNKLIENLFQKAPESYPQNKDDNPKEYKILTEYLVIFKGKDKAKFLKKELDLFKTAIYTDPEDSSVWFYMKWLISDFFIKDIKDEEISISIIEHLINDIKELNELEFSDNEVENKWCLISIVYLIKQLYKLKKLETDKQEFTDILKRLEKIDPMRAERYEEFKIED